MTIKTVSLTLAPVQVKVKAKKGMSDLEVVELAKKVALKQMKESFPRVTYSIADGVTISLEEAKIGQIIKHEGNYGVITDVKVKNKFPINITLKNGVKLKVTPLAIEKAEDESALEKVMKPRPEWQKKDNYWDEGNCGYLVVKDNVVPVVCGGGTKTKYRFYIVSHQAESRYYELTQQQLRFVFDTKEEAEKSIKK